MSDRTSKLDLTPSILLRAYAAGVFPMAESATAEDVLWIDPELRGILPLERFHLPRSLAKTVKRGDFDITIDSDFEGVINGCAERETTWINGEIKRLYLGLFRMGYAHSVEVRQNGELVGGLYGVRLGAAFFGESMFSTVRDASKVALVYLVARLKVGGFQLLDTQFVTDHLEQFGARTISRSRYHDQLERAVAISADFDLMNPDLSGHDVAQLSTQMSYL